MRNNATLFAAVVALGACQKPAETPEQAQARLASESAAAKAAIDSLNLRFINLLKAGQGDSVALAYAEDGVAMPPNAPAARGRDAIKAFWSAVFPLHPGGSVRSEVVTAQGDHAIERGAYTLTMTPPGAKEPATDNGKYVVHWRRVDGKWLIVDDIWNSDRPAAPPPAK
jgi:uncharacterized protein (TIGR02246 family)